MGARLLTIVLGMLACWGGWSIAASSATGPAPSTTWILVGAVVILVGLVMVVSGFIARTEDIEDWKRRPESASTSVIDDRPWERHEGGLITSPGEVGSKDHFFSKVVGVTRRRSAVKKARKGDRLRLRREPKNKFDPNAIAIDLEKTGDQLGYVPRETAEYLSRQMSSGALYEARIEDLTGGVEGAEERGLNIRVWRSGWKD